MKCFVDTEPTRPYVDDGISLWQAHNHSLADFHYIVANNLEIVFEGGCGNFQHRTHKEQNELLDLFEYHTQGIDQFVAFNYQVDLKWLLAAYRQVDRNIPEVFATPWLEFGSILGIHWLKWPALSVAYKELFGRDLKNAHTARADVHAMFEIYNEIAKDDGTFH